MTGATFSNAQIEARRLEFSSEIVPVTLPFARLIVRSYYNWQNIKSETEKAANNLKREVRFVGVEPGDDLDKLLKKLSTGHLAEFKFLPMRSWEVCAFSWQN